MHSSAQMEESSDIDYELAIFSGVRTDQLLSSPLSFVSHLIKASLSPPSFLTCYLYL